MKAVLVINHDCREVEDAVRLLRENGYDVDVAPSEAAIPEKIPSHPDYLTADLLQNAPVGIFRSTLDGRFIWVNWPLSRILGYDSPEDLIETVNRRSIAEVLYLEPGQRREVVEEIPLNKEWQIFELQYRRKDGSVVTCRDHIRKVPGLEGTISELEGFVEDVTDRKRAEALLRENLTRLQAMVRNAPIILYSVDQEGIFTFSEGKGLAGMGLKPGEIVGLSAFEVYRDHPDCLENFRRSITGEAFNAPVQIGDHVFEAYHEPVYGDDGSYTGTVGVVVDVTERTNAEEELHKSNELLRAIIDAAPTAIIGLDLEGRVQAVWNQAAERMLGWSAVEAMGNFLPTVPLDKEEEFRRFRDLIRSGKELNGVEVSRRRRDGTAIDYSIYASPLHGPEGNIIGNIAVLVDITDRKRSDEELIRSEEKYRVVADFTYDWETWMDPDGRFIYVSPSCERITGYTREEFINDTTLISKILHPDDRQGVEKQIADAAADIELVHHMDFRILTRSGEERSIEHICQPVFSSDGKWLGRRASNRDITGRKQAEKALRESEEKFRVLAETSPTAIVLFQGEMIIYANPATECLFGYTSDELLHMRFWEWAHGDFREMVRERGLAKQRGEPVPSRYESMFVTKTGEERWLVVSVGTIEFHGRPAGVASLLDITDLKRIEGELRGSVTEKEILLKEVHHRVKNNLQIITSLLDLQSDYIKEEDSKRYIRESQGRIRSMALVHEQLYKSSDLSRIDFAGYVNDLVNYLSIASKLGSAAVELRVNVADVSMEMETAIPCGLIVNELVSNSLKHAFPGGRQGEITVACFRESEGTIVLEVSDDGVGLPAGMDFRTTNTMGLLIVNLLVRQMKADIEVRNEGGLSYRIRFRAGPDR